MNLKIYGDIEGLREGMAILASRLGVSISEDGFPVKVEKKAGSIIAESNGEKGLIRFNERIHFFRAFGLWIEAMRQENVFRIIEEPQFEMDGIMIDVSRNSVMRVESIKRTLEIMSLMGLNMLMLYTEDTYAIDGNPYFGYMRGRYTENELKECDAYADILGIEMIPCIQTLAHLSSALKWSFADDIKDTEDILLVGNERTYAFIEDMIEAASRPFKSRKIYIGMDEAQQLGLGRYLAVHGYKRRFDLMNEHLAKVKEITQKFGLSPIIWSDMYFRIASEDGEYYDPKAVIPEDVAVNIPRDVELVYWDYYHNDEEAYIDMIRKHRRMGCDCSFAGGIWTWNGMNIQYPKTFKATNAALSACKKEGVRKVFATLWGDNGSETNFFSALLGLQLYAEHGYARELDAEKLERRFKFCTGNEFDAFMDLSLFNPMPSLDSEDIHTPSNPSKLFLWQDLLLGLFDRHAAVYDFPAYYSRVADKLSKDRERAGEWQLVFDTPAKLALVLAVKSHIGLKIKEYYDNHDISGLECIVNQQLPELKERVLELHASHRRQWFNTYKPFGWEVLDLRYGGLIARIESAVQRLTQYLAGSIDLIEELEEERLYFDGPKREEGRRIGFCNYYHRIVSASSLGFNE